MTAQTDLMTAFTHDHRFLDNAFAKAQRAASWANWDTAPQAFRDFWDAIETHMTTEEEQLFPVYEAGHGDENPLTGILRKGHRDLWGFFEEISETIENHDAEEASALMDTVAQILSHHDEKEEKEFYPAVAPLIPDPQKLISRLACVEPWPLPSA